MPLVKTIISPSQCRMARAAIGLSVRQLAEVAEIGVTTLVRFETGDEAVKTATIDKLVAVFEARGVTFTYGDTWVAVKVQDSAKWRGQPISRPVTIKKV